MMVKSLVVNGKKPAIFKTKTTVSGYQLFLQSYWSLRLPSPSHYDPTKTYLKGRGTGITTGDWVVGIWVG